MTSSLVLKMLMSRLIVTSFQSLCCYGFHYRKKMDADCDMQEIDVETEDCEVRTDGSGAQAHLGKTILADDHNF